MKNVLVLCTGNSCRSQIAESYLREYLGDKANIFSAGIEAHGMNRNAIKVMVEDGIDISQQYSKTVDDLGDLNFDIVLTVCDNALENCPVLPGKAEKFHFSFPDPAKATGTEVEILEAFRAVRNQVKIVMKEVAQIIVTI